MFPDTLVVLGIHSPKFPAEHETSNVRHAVERLGIAHPVASDADGSIWRSYAVRAWPTLILLDVDGRIADTTAGEIEAEEYAHRVASLESEAGDRLDRSPLALAAPPPASAPGVLRYPSRVLVAGEDRLFVADTGHHRVIELALGGAGEPARVVRAFGSGVAGLADGPAGSACFDAPRGLALRGGELLVADADAHAIRAVSLEDGSVSTVAGTGRKGSGWQRGGSPLEISLRSPWALEVVDNLVFVAMAGSHQIWVLVEGELGPFAGNGREALVDGPRTRASFNQPSDVVLLHGHLIVADAEASAIRAIRLDAEPNVFTLVGMGLFEFGDVDGSGPTVRMQHPTGLATDGRLLYVADTFNHKLKTLDVTTGRAATLAGTVRPGHADGPFETASFHEPEGLAVDGDRVYVADTNNHALRRLDLSERTTSTIEVVE